MTAPVVASRTSTACTLDGTGCTARSTRTSRTAGAADVAAAGLAGAAVVAALAGSATAPTTAAPTTVTERVRRRFLATRTVFLLSVERPVKTLFRDSFPRCRQENL